MPENVLTRLHRDGRDSECEEQFAVQRQVKVVGEGEQMRGQAREEAREAGGVGPKVGDGAHADHAVRVVAEDVSPIGWEVGRLRRRVSGGKTGTKSSRRSVCDVFRGSQDLILR